MIINLPGDYEERCELLDRLLQEHGLLLHTTSVERVVDTLAHLSDSPPENCYCPRETP
jgi:hypothetical protein